MTRALPVILMLLLGCGDSIAPGPAGRREAVLARPLGRQLAQLYQSRLRGELLVAVESGDSSAVRRVCGERARALAEELGVAAEPPARIRRVALHPLGENGQPDPWERLALEHFAHERELRGQAPEDWVQRLEREGGRRLRYYQPIPAAPPCLGCHGGEVDGAHDQVPQREATMLGLLSIEFRAKDLSK